MYTPLYTALLAHSQKNRSAFHTPGHKNNPTALPKELFSLDFTELPDTDSLYEASGAILQAEQHASKVFGSHGTLFSAGGCSLCIQTMLRLATQGGKRKLLSSRVLHRSAVHAMALLDLQPIWLLPTPNSGAGLPGRITKETVEQALQAHPDAAGVYLTSPDYHGVLSPIAELAAVCQQYRVPLLVDNAHGAHLGFTSSVHPLQAGAAMTADSPHKTLNVLTGGAMLHLGEKQYLPHAKSAMALFGSTSPNYMVMASLDYATAWLKEQGKGAYHRLEEQVNYLKGYATELDYLLPQGDCDPTRLTVLTDQLSISGTTLAQHMRSHGVEVEYADNHSVVCIATPFQREGDFLRLKNALTLGSELPKESLCKASPLPPLPRQVLFLRQAVLSPQKRLPLAKALGKIAAEAPCPCPPGVPVVMMGEEITDEVVDCLQGYGIEEIAVIDN